MFGGSPLVFLSQSSNFSFQSFSSTSHSRISQPYRTVSSLFGGDVLDSVNKAYREKDSTLYQIYQKQMFSDFY